MVFITEGFFRSSYSKLARVGFQPTTTEFRSEALTNWAIRPWVQLTLRANFVQLLQLHLCSVFTFHSGLCLRQSPHLLLSEVSHRSSRCSGMNWYIQYSSRKDFLEVVIESWPEWDLNPWPLNSVLETDWAITPWVQLTLRANFVYISGHEFRSSSNRSWVQLTLGANFVQLLQFRVFFSVHISFRPLPSSVANLILIE